LQCSSSGHSPEIIFRKEKIKINRESEITSCFAKTDRKAQIQIEKWQLFNQNTKTQIRGQKSKDVPAPLALWRAETKA
jgi:hypothetical protein